MKSALKTFVVLALGAVLAGSASARTSVDGLFGDLDLKIGIRGGFAGRTVHWDKGSDESRLKTRTLGLAADLTLARGLGLSVFAGLGCADPEGAIFRELPISLKYGGGAVSGFAFGGSIRKTLFMFGDFETGARASYVSCTGSSKSWPIEGFAVDGDAQGRPKWSEIEVGPTLIYTAIEGFRPFVGVSLDWFRGDFRLTESLGELHGTQTRKLAQKGILRIALGASYDLWRGLVVDGEAGVIPSKGTTDVVATIRLIYGF
jgi:hypothetical protein